MMNREAFAKLAVGKIGFRHMRLHSYAMGSIILQMIAEINIENQMLKRIPKNTLMA